MKYIHTYFKAEIKTQDNNSDFICFYEVCCYFKGDLIFSYFIPNEDMSTLKDLSYSLAHRKLSYQIINNPFKQFCIYFTDSRGILITRRIQKRLDPKFYWIFKEISNAL